MTEYLSLQQVIDIHNVMIKRFGGLAGIRDKNLLLSALEAPKASFGGAELYPSIFEKAATYLYHIIRNHPFNDGNKRTAYFVTLLFLEANNIVNHFKKTNLEKMAVLTAEGKISKEQLAFFLETGKHPIF
jgi:death-on-curing protein